MVYKFKPRKSIKVLLTIVALIFCIALFRDAYLYLTNPLSALSFQDSLILTGTIVMAYFALSFNIMNYKIENDHPTVKNLITKRKYFISDIEIIDELRDYLFPSIKIHFRGGKTLNVVPIDNHDQFLQALENNLRERGTSWTHTKNKT